MVLISHLRCTLMGLERDYRVKVLSNQIKFYRQYSMYSSCFPLPAQAAAAAAAAWDA